MLAVCQRCQSMWSNKMLRRNLLGSTWLLRQSGRRNRNRCWMWLLLTPHHMRAGLNRGEVGRQLLARMQAPGPVLPELTLLKQPLNSLKTKSLKNSTTKQYCKWWKKNLDWLTLSGLILNWQGNRILMLLSHLPLVMWRWLRSKAELSSLSSHHSGR